MAAEIYRKYIDIINENSQPEVLDEGIMDTLKSAASKVFKALGGDTMAMIAQKVKDVTGGDYSLTKDNAIKVAKALGFEGAVQDKEGQAQMAEGLAGNWQGKLLQALHLGGTVGGLGSAAIFGPFMNPLFGIGIILLLATATFWDDSRGMVGAMGKYGNKGWETGKGPRGIG